MEEITLEQARGETIANFVFSYDGDMLITFKSGAYIFFTMQREDYGDDMKIIAAELKPLEFGEADLIKAGIFTEKELDEMRVLHSDTAKLRQEETERAQYSRLKKKYG